MKKLSAFDIIREPLITEKSTGKSEQGKYCFKVHPSAGKIQIKNAVEKAYSVTVKKVHTMNVRGKMKRVRYQPGFTSKWKKAIVTLKSGDKIDFT